MVDWFLEQFNKVFPEQFITCINRIKPSLIRVEADEVSYNIHVLIHFELEKAITVKELPSLWNQKYKEYLEIEVPNDALCLLQDIHWSHGSIGYFPTYTLGNFYAAQIWHTYQQENSDANFTRLFLTEPLFEADVLNIFISAQKIYNN